MGHSVGQQTVQLGHAQLHGIEPEDIGQGIGKLALLPRQGVPALRGIPPIVQTYNLLTHAPRN